VGTGLREGPEGREKQGALVNMDEVLREEPLIHIHTNRNLAKRVVSVGIQIILYSCYAITAIT